MRTCSHLFILIFIGATTGFAGNRKLDIPVPLNEDVLGIRIPYYNEEGFQEMQLDAQIARKTDEDHAALKGVKITLFEKDQSPLLLEMPAGTFDLQTNILYGNEGVTVKRQDLDILAHSIILKTEERFAQFKGKVKMTIVNLDLQTPHSENKSVESK
ncbi:MAG: hypothetical protein C5B47_07650 [Verrucomicrobia bacterium]|nr:MAG: hypothetical protein C5B47_07650 [Verrucomicrobiota bacterium]